MLPRNALVLCLYFVSLRRAISAEILNGQLTPPGSSYSHFVRALRYASPFQSRINSFCRQFAPASHHGVLWRPNVPIICASVDGLTSGDVKPVLPDQFEDVDIEEMEEMQDMEDMEEMEDNKGNMKPKSAAERAFQEERDYYSRMIDAINSTEETPRLPPGQSKYDVLEAAGMIQDSSTINHWIIQGVIQKERGVDWYQKADYADREMWYKFAMSQVNITNITSIQSRILAEEAQQAGNEMLRRKWQAASAAWEFCAKSSADVALKGWSTKGLKSISRASDKTREALEDMKESVGGQVVFGQNHLGWNMTVEVVHDMWRVVAKRWIKLAGKGEAERRVERRMSDAQLNDLLGGDGQGRRTTGKGRGKMKIKIKRKGKGKGTLRSSSQMLDLFAQDAPDGIYIPALALLGLSIGSVVTCAVLSMPRFCRRVLTSTWLS